MLFHSHHKGVTHALTDANSTPAWPAIALTWRQSVAAFWCLAWPALLAMMATISFWPNEDVRTAATVTNLVLILVQPASLPRLVRKNFHLFRIDVLRGDAETSHALSLSEIARFSLPLVWPQFAFFIAADFARQLGRFANSSPFLLIWLLVIGPWAFNFALRKTYPGFRLQPFGIRYI